MLATRFIDVKGIVANALSLSSNDNSRIASYVNRACQRLLEEGKWKGTTVRVRICITSGTCITWPREIETIEAAAICNWPITLRNGWYEFLPAGPGVAGTTCCMKDAIDMGEFPAFDDVQGTGKKLAVYAEAQEAVGKSIILQFTDGNGNWVRTTDPITGVVIDGEKLVIGPKGTYVYTTNTCAANGLAHVIKDTTVGVVRVYEYDPATSLLRPLGYYQPDENVPVYRRTRLPGVQPQSTTTTDTSCSSRVLDAKATIRFIAAYDDNDWLPISHPEAIRLACQAVLREENGKLEDALAYWQMAYRCLDKQLKKYTGDGVQQPIVMATTQMPAVRNLI